MAIRNSALAILTFLVLSVYAQKPTIELRDDFKKYYEQFKVEGSFVLYDQNKDEYIFYNQSQYNQPFTPSSIYKICNSLIGLETVVIKDENFVIEWDSISRQNPSWNKDHDLKTAFRNSTVWYYQELARRVGGQQMKYWLDKAKYGNADTSGGIDKFWLTGGLRVTPEQEIDFLKRLYNNKLPFSQRSMDIVKKIMVTEQTPFYTISSKTGWGGQDNKDVGWYVGYLETKGNVYYFVNCIQTTDFNNNNFSRARVDITNQILMDLKLTTNENLKKLSNCITEKHYHSNGQIHLIQQLDTVMHCNCGIYQEFDSLGILRVEGQYTRVDSIECKNCFIGSMHFNDDRTPSRWKKNEYVDACSMRVGIWKTYHSNGKLHTVGEYSPKIHSFGSSSITNFDQTEEYLKENNIVLKDSGPINVGVSYQELKQGVWFYFDETGRKIKAEEYIDGDIVFDKE